MDPTLLPLLLLAGAPQDAQAPPPRVTAIAVVRAHILSGAHVSFAEEAPPSPAIEPPRERRAMRDDGRVEIQFE